MSIVKIWVHLVFTTKNRTPYLSSNSLREQVFNHIKENAKSKGIWIDSINGYKEHIHCLISLNKDYSISKTVQLIKGESAHWINQNNLTKFKFQWQDDYWAVSLSENQINNLRKYLNKQEEHHKQKSFTEEIKYILEDYF